MRLAFFILLSLHGLIHLLGFLKAYKLAQVSQISTKISRFHGFLWLIAALLFLASASLFLSESEIWWMTGLSAVLISQYLIFVVWKDAKFGSLANLVVLLIGIIGLSSWNFQSSYTDDVKRGIALNTDINNELLTEADIQQLPVPVQSYLQYTGVVGKPRLSNFRVRFSGKIRSAGDKEWMFIDSEQYSFLKNPERLFFLKADMKKLPVAGYHRFQNGNASMDIRLLSLFPVQQISGDEMNRSETVTFFNDMCIMAPASLIDPRIEWLETSDKVVKAAFTANGVRITADLYFNENGQLVNFSSDDRFALLEDGSMKQYTWTTPVKEYRRLAGYRLPAVADAVYQYPEGAFVYASFVIEEIDYNLTQSSPTTHVEQRMAPQEFHAGKSEL